MRRGIAFFAIFLLAPNLSSADEPKRSISAADLVLEVIEQDQAILEARSLFLRFKGTWTHPEESIARQTAGAGRRYQNAADIADLKPKSMELLEMAFDEERIRRLSVSAKRTDLRVWDGSRVIVHERYENNKQEHYAFDASPFKFIGGLFTNDLSCWRMGNSSLWFLPQYTPEVLAQVYGAPTDYTITGNEEFRGRKCLVLENRKVRRRIYIGADDHRLYGILTLFTPNEPKIDPLAEAERVLGRKFASQEELKQALLELSDAEHKELTKKAEDALWEYNKPLFEHYLDDYQELAPGILFPRKQGYAIFHTSDKGETTVESRRDMQLVEFKINEPLDDHLFRIEIPDGVKVFDWGHDPPLQYAYDSHRTNEEFQRIVEEARNSDQEWIKEQAAREALVNQPAPELPKGDWLGSEPLKWPKLRGNVVLLVFWDHRLRPCDDTLSLLQTQFANRAGDGLAVIGIHAPSSEGAKIKKKMEKLGVTYPVMIDLPVFDPNSISGTLAKQCHVKHLPFTMVIDRDGKVTAIGEPADVLPKAIELLEHQPDDAN